MQPLLPISPTLARRLAITRQHLTGATPAANAGSILDIVRDLGCLQIDPINAVARSHTLVVFSRVGAYDPAHLDALLWRDRKLFEYWAHCASIVLTEDYPIHRAMMRDFLKEESVWGNRIRNWIGKNEKLRRGILNRIKREGALPSRAFAEEGVGSKHWISTGWTSEQNVSRMLNFLWLSGMLMVARREGLQKFWDLSERVLPEWTPREKWSEREVVRAAAQKSLRALGVATPKQIAYHFIRGRYPNLKRTLAELEAEHKIQRVQIGKDSSALKGDWYIHTDDLPLLDSLANGEWQPRTTLLSPFDNLICDRARTKMLFDFDYTIEIYVPKEKRKYGYYVLPILHGDQLIGRIDSAVDRENARLVINAVYSERTAPKTRAAGAKISTAIEELGKFLGAKEIVFGKRVPKEWKLDS